MAFFHALVFLAAVAGSCYARPEEGTYNVKAADDEFFQLERKVLNKCNKDLNAPQSAIENLLNMEKLDDSRAGKCLVKCAMNKFGVMQKDGHLNEERTLAYIRHAYYKPETQEKVKELSDLCIHKVEKDEDHCEHAFNYLQCMLEETTKYNIPKIHEEKTEIKEEIEKHE